VLGAETTDPHRRGSVGRMLYVLLPELSEVDLDGATALIDAAIREWDDVPIARIGRDALIGCEPGPEDGVVFFNPLRADAAADAEDLLVRARREGAVVLPIAMESEHRRPPEAAGDRQSFDVVDQLRRRELTDDQLAVVGVAFARGALSVIMPTFVQSRLRLFLCHRRSDGEQLTALVDQHLAIRHEHVFRDLIDVQVGQQAQEEIDAALASADAVVFLDTPRAGESWWIQHELATALGRGIPVIWVRLGGDAERGELPTKPAAAPHILVAEQELTRQRAGEIADEVLRVAPRLARQHLRTSQQALHDLKKWAAEHDAGVDVLDARQRIFQVRYPASPAARAYPVRAASDVVQFFGRAVGEADRPALETFLNDRGLGPHDRDCRAFDAAILLDPTASGHRSVGEWSVVEHPSRFLGSLLQLQSAVVREQVRPRLLLLGAYPSGDFARDQIAPAVQATAATWMRLGGVVVCGGHPTFVPLLTEVARLIHGDAGREALVVFWSEWFAAPAQVEELQSHAQVVLTPRRDTRAESLTVMRELMVRDGGASVVLAMGGRTNEGGEHQPGIEEEIRLARMADLPVYLLGAPGGQAALIASREAASETPWANLGNRLDAEGNALLRETDAYEEAVRLIWGTL
jgi:hypothetical protein